DAGQVFERAKVVRLRISTWRTSWARRPWAGSISSPAPLLILRGPAVQGGAMVLDALSAADRVNLLELYARSVMLIELGRTREWAELFAPQGWARCEIPPDQSVRRSFNGREQLLDLARRMAAGEFDLATGPLTPATPCRR